MAILLPLLALRTASLMSPRPDHLGITEGRLAPCPESPNCVSTQAGDASHRMEPIPFNGSAEEARTVVKQVIAALPRMTIVAETGNYLHVEATSLIFRFVDDVEFFIDGQAGMIHFRSASRVGHSDLGANRKRMTMFRERLRQRLAENENRQSGDP